MARHSIVHIINSLLLNLVMMSQLALANDIPTVSFTVNEFSILGENPISAEETNRVLEPFLGEHQGLEGLLEAAAELEAAILNAGFSFNRVVLPPQTLKQGIVELKVTQIKLANIEVEGNEHFTDENIIRSLPGLVIGTVPDTRKLARQLIVANNHPSKRITVRMKQSEQPESVDTVLDVQDRRPWQIFSVLNNIGTSKTGRLRFTAGGQHNNVLGFDDSLTGSYTTSPGNTSDVKQWGLNYRIPVYKYSGSFSFFYSRSDVDSGTIQSVFDVSGAGKFLGGSYTHTFLNRKNYRHRMSIGVDDKLFENDVAFLGAPIGVDVRSRPMTLSYFGEYQMEKARINFNLSHVRNLNGGNRNTKAIYAASRAGAEQDWDVVRYSATYNRSLSKTWLMRFYWQGQWSNEPLISGEQFGIGGINSVRGFEERAVTGDRGDQATLEFSRPLTLFGQDVRIRLFSDVGHVKIIQPAVGQIHSQTLANVGAGLSWQWKDKLSVSIDYAHELNDGRTADIGGTKNPRQYFLPVLKVMYALLFNQKFIFPVILLLLNVSAYAANASQNEIGEVVFSRGIVSAESSNGEVRVLGKEAPIFLGDVITSGPKSFAVLKMLDGARFSIRPDSVFSFENYSLKENDEGAVMQLFKGGLRAISGLISKRNPEAFKLNTTVATIGIRGTDFDARLCEVDCAIENLEHEKKLAAVAKVAFLRGDVNAIAKDSQKRKLELSSPVYEGETIVTGKKAYAVLAFNDKSRMTLKAETEIKIEKHRFVSPESDENGAVYNLFKGGIRALTGLISKVKKDTYKLKTPTATIGIRGTGYDVVWLGPCTGGATSCGLNGSVWLGAIYAKNDAGEFELLENQSFIVRLADTPATITDTPPILDIPRPDEVDINFEELFSDETEDVPSGLYANTREGVVYMERDGEIIEMQPGEGGFVSSDGTIIVKLVRPKSFQSNDPYLQTINEEFETLYELLDDSVIEQNEFECIVQ